MRLGGDWEERVAEADEGEQLRPGGGRAVDDPEQDLEEQAEPPRHRPPNRRRRMAPLLNRRHLRRRRHLSEGGAETSREDGTGRKQSWTGRLLSISFVWGRFPSRKRNGEIVTAELSRQNPATSRIGVVLHG